MIVKLADATALSVKPPATVIALMVCDEPTEMGPVYTAELVVGVPPLVV